MRFGEFDFRGGRLGFTPVSQGKPYVDLDRKRGDQCVFSNLTLREEDKLIFVGHLENDTN